MKLDNPYCMQCGQPCEIKKEECGIGIHEYMGCTYNDVKYKWVSVCCDAPVCDGEPYDCPIHGLQDGECPRC